MITEIIVYNQDTATPLQNESWYIQLLEDCRDIVVETEFASRWSLVEGYHSLGKRILEESERFKKYDERVDYKAQIASDLNRSKRTVYYAVQFAREYPDLNLLNEGKNISWHHIVNKYLTTGEKKPTIKKVDLYRMIKEIKKLLNIEYSKAHQNEVEAQTQELFTRTDLLEYLKAQSDFIRYLQDQVNKITSEAMSERMPAAPNG